MLGLMWRRSDWLPGRGRVVIHAAALVLGALPALSFPAPSWWGLGGYVLTTQYWLLPSIGPLLMVLAAGLGALWLPWGWAAHRLLSAPVTPRRTLAAVIVLPSAWVMAEAVRSWQSLGGPWALLGASQWNQPATMASASLGGVWLTSFLLVAANTAIVGAILHRDVSGRVIALAIALACVA